MKLIFLDIDGVMNSLQSMQDNKHLGIHRDIPTVDHVNHLNYIIASTDARIVISSSWRVIHSSSSIDLILCLQGFKYPGYVISSTITHKYHRGDEIQDWLDMASNKIQRFVILDDCNDMLHLKQFLVQTDSNIGLTKQDADKAIKILNQGETNESV